MDVSVWEALASFTLIAIAAILSRISGLGIERSIVWASLRAAAQLLAVGLLLETALTSDRATLWAWIWVAGMVLLASWIVRRRGKKLRHLWLAALAAMAASTAVALGVVFGLGILEPEPVAIVVIAGITIGNSLPAAVLAADRVVVQQRDERDQAEALLALGFSARQATRVLVPETARTALIPQVERTKIVGLVALPGAMTGLLLAGVDPVSAVLVQVVVMYLVLGSVAISVITVALAGTRSTFTADLRLDQPAS